MPLLQLRSHHGSQWCTCVSWNSHTSNNITFLSKATEYFFSHALAEVRGENTLEIKFTSTGYRTHNHQTRAGQAWSFTPGRFLPCCWSYWCITDCYCMTYAVNRMLKKRKRPRWPWIAHLNFWEDQSKFFFVAFRKEFTRISLCPYSASSRHSLRPCLSTDQNFANNF